MEHEDLYRSYGQFYLQLARPVLPPHGEARSNWEVCAMLARALGVATTHYAKTPVALIRECLAGGSEPVRGITYERLAAEGSVRLNLPRPYLPFANGAPTASGKVELYSERMAARGMPALPTCRGPARRPALVPLGRPRTSRRLAPATRSRRRIRRPGLGDQRSRRVGRSCQALWARTCPQSLT